MGVRNSSYFVLLPYIFPIFTVLLQVKDYSCSVSSRSSTVARWICYCQGSSLLSLIFHLVINIAVATGN